MSIDDFSGETIASLISQIQSLNDLFARRLLDDREKAKSFDVLYKELEVSRSFAEGEVLLPLIRRLIVLLDRVNQEESEFSRSIEAEIVEALFVFGVLELVPNGGIFDPATQEGVNVETDEFSAGEVIAVRRRGWSYHGKLIRPSLVEVASSASNRSGEITQMNADLELDE